MTDKQAAKFFQWLYGKGHLRYDGLPIILECAGETIIVTPGEINEALRHVIFEQKEEGE